MDEETVKQCDTYLPRLSKRAVEALSSQLRRAVFGLVASRGPKSFSEIMETFQVNQGSLSRQLQKLEIGGLVSNYFRRTPDSREFSFYEATDFGKGIVNALARAFESRLRSEESEEMYVGIVDAGGPQEAVAANRVLIRVEARHPRRGDEVPVPAVSDGTQGWFLDS